LLYANVTAGDPLRTPLGAQQVINN